MYEPGKVHTLCPVQDSLDAFLREVEVFTKGVAGVDVLAASLSEEERGEGEHFPTGFLEGPA